MQGNIAKKCLFLKVIAFEFFVQILSIPTRNVTIGSQCLKKQPLDFKSDT